jgi:hypothetical protein
MLPIFSITMAYNTRYTQVPNHSTTYFYEKFLVAFEIAIACDFKHLYVMIAGANPINLFTDVFYGFS